MDREQFTRLITLYKQNYRLRDEDMPLDLINLWYAKLKDFDYVHVAEAFGDMISQKQFKFSCSAVLDHIQYKHPSNKQVKEVQSWRNMDIKTNKEKRAFFTNIANQMISREESFYSQLPELAKEFIRIWGVKEAGSMVVGMHHTDEQREFTKHVNLELRKA